MVGNKSVGVLRQVVGYSVAQGGLNEMNMRKRHSVKTEQRSNQVISFKLRLSLRYLAKIEEWIQSIAKSPVSCQKSQDENNNK